MLTHQNSACVFKLFESICVIRGAVGVNKFRNDMVKSCAWRKHAVATSNVFLCKCCLKPSFHMIAHDCRIAGLTEA